MNMSVYIWKNRVLNMPDFWTCLTQNIIYKVFVQITEQLSKVQVHNQKFFRTCRVGGFAELGHFDKHFVKNTRKGNPKFRKSGHFFDFKKGTGSLSYAPPPSPTPTQSPWICLNILKFWNYNAFEIHVLFYK